MVHRMDMKADIYNNNDDNNNNDNDNDSNNNNNNNSNDIYDVLDVYLDTYCCRCTYIVYTIRCIIHIYIYIVLIYNVMPENCTT